MSFQQRLDSIQRLTDLRERLSDAIEVQGTALTDEVYASFEHFLRERLGLAPREDVRFGVALNFGDPSIAIHLYKVGELLGHCILLGSRPLCWFSKPFHIPLVEIERAREEFRQANPQVYYVMPSSQGFHALSLDLIEASLFMYKVTPLRVGLQRLKGEDPIRYFLLQVDNWREVWLELPRGDRQPQPPVRRIIEGSVDFKATLSALEYLRLPM